MSPEILSGIGVMVGGAIGYLVKHLVVDKGKKDNDSAQQIIVNPAMAGVPSVEAGHQKFCGQAHIDLCVAVVEIKADIKDIRKDQINIGNSVNRLESKVRETEQGINLAAFRTDKLLNHFGIK